MSNEINGSRSINVNLFSVDECFDNAFSVILKNLFIDTEYSFEITDKLNNVIDIGQSIILRDDGFIIFIPKGLDKNKTYSYKIKSISTDHDKKYLQTGNIRVV